MLQSVKINAIAKAGRKSSMAASLIALILWIFPSSAGTALTYPTR
jgi:hypothetical protein